MNSNTHEIQNWQPMPVPGDITPTHFLAGGRSVPARSGARVPEDATHWSAAPAMQPVGSASPLDTDSLAIVDLNTLAEDRMPETERKFWAERSATPV